MQTESNAGVPAATGGWVGSKTASHFGHSVSELAVSTSARSQRDMNTFAVLWYASCRLSIYATEGERHQGACKQLPSVQKHVQTAC